MGISVIILTFNEERNLAQAIDSVAGWAQEIFVVDSYSTDRTVEIALSRAAEGVSVVQHPFRNYSAQWNWALSELPLQGEWTLKLDADERLTADLREEITARVLKGPSSLMGAYVRWRLMFLGSPIHWGGVSEQYHLRMWRTGTAVFEDREVNEHAIVPGEKISLESPLEHHDYKSLTHWLSKHNRYSSMEAACLLQGNVAGEVRPRLFGASDERRIWLRRLYFRLPLRPLLFFLLHYVFRLGMLDGRAGLRFWLLRSIYMYWIDLKLFEAKLTGVPPETEWPARGQPHPAVKNSALQRLCEAPVVPFQQRKAA